MSYYSVQFAFFFAAVVTLYYLAPGRFRVPVLLIASAFFYMQYIPQYIVILLMLITIDYCAGILIEREASPRKKKGYLIVSLVANLGLMTSFKYSADVFGVSLGPMPLGLSFHTFQSIAYTIEVYRGRQKAERSFFVYSLYVLFFPQIAAGPIERPQNLIHQFKETHRFEYANVVPGLQLMAWGFFQKYVIAASIGMVVNPIYLDHARLSGPVVVLAALMFPFQILCDFSGYSDIAIGAAQVLGFRLSRNFNRPFHADSMAEYWKRWHISFSQWLRDYVFFPFCGKRPGTARICAGIMLIFLGNGLWHGARWNYLISGLLHGTYRVTEFLGKRALSRAGWSLSPGWQEPMRLLRIATVFLLMALAFVFFRGDNLTHTLGILSSMSTGWSRLFSPDKMLEEISRAGLSMVRIAVCAALIGLLQIVHWVQAGGSIRLRLAAQPAWLRWSFYYAAVATLLLVARDEETFIYFKF